MSDLKTLQQLAEKRRSIYALNDQLPVSNEEVVQVVEHAILHTPSSFNSQSTRIVVLFGDDHNKLWDMTEETLRVIVGDEEAFKSTKEKSLVLETALVRSCFLRIKRLSEACKKRRLFMQKTSQFGRRKPMPCISM